MASTTETYGKHDRPRPPRAVFLWAALALIAGAAAFGCKNSSTGPSAGGKNPRGAEVKAVMRLETFVVNLADPEEGRFLRVGIDLGLENPPTAKGGHGEESGVSTARIRDTILGVLTTWRSDALLASDGKQKLKDELVRALRTRVPELGVREVYFTDFLVQR